MKTTKPALDWEKGIRRRARIDNELNQYFTRINSTIQIEPINPFLKKMTSLEKIQNCTLDNFVIPQPITAMGLYRKVVDRDGGKFIHLIYLFKKGGFFLKIPHEYKDVPDVYLKVLHELNFYALPVDDEEFGFGSPLDFLDIQKYWGYKMAGSKGNKNRLQFHGKVSKVNCLPLGEKDIFNAPLEDMLKSLIKRVNP